MLKNVAIYGAGVCGRYVFENISLNSKSKISIVEWIDNYKEGALNNVPIVTDSFFLKSRNAEAVIVAMLNTCEAFGIAMSLANRGFNNIYFVHPQCVRNKYPILNSDGEFSMFVWKFNEFE